MPRDVASGVGRKRGCHAATLVGPTLVRGEVLRVGDSQGTREEAGITKTKATSLFKKVLPGPAHVLFEPTLGRDTVGTRHGVRLNTKDALARPRPQEATRTDEHRASADASGVAAFVKRQRE